jgi:hypothetical protein
MKTMGGFGKFFVVGFLELRAGCSLSWQKFVAGIKWSWKKLAGHVTRVENLRNEYCI